MTWFLFFMRHTTDCCNFIFLIFTLATDQFLHKWHVCVLFWIYTSSHDQSVLVLLLGSWTVFNISPPNTSAASKQSYDAFPLRLDSSNIQWTRNEFYLTSGTRAVWDSSQMNWHKSVRLAGVTEGLESGVWVRWHEVLWKRYWHPFTPLHSFPNTHTPTVSKFLCARKWQDPSEIKSRVY